MFLAKHEPDQYIAGGDKVGNKMFLCAYCFWETMFTFSTSDILLLLNLQTVKI